MAGDSAGAVGDSSARDTDSSLDGDLDSPQDGGLDSSPDGDLDSSQDGGLDSSPDGDLDSPSEAAMDAPPDTAEDAPAEAMQDAPAEADAVTPSDGPPGSPPASCLEILQSTPSAASGVYVLTTGGQQFDAYCDMTLGGGGWTAFFVGSLGATHVFGHFDVAPGQTAPTDSCASPASQCLRHIPNSVTMANEFAATCGGEAVKFTTTPAVLDFFRAGVSRRWVELLNMAPLSPNAQAAYAGWLWTGDGANNQGWILSADDAEPVATNHTFASSYDSASAGWDFCNGVDYNSTNVTPTVMLFYR
jgi:hypothetical protein